MRCARNIASWNDPGHSKSPIVNDDIDWTDFVFRRGTTATKTGTTVYAWALMRNHTHMLVRSGNSGLRGFMCKLLTGYASSCNRRHHRWGHVFQNRYTIDCLRRRPLFSTTCQLYSSESAVCRNGWQPWRTGFVSMVRTRRDYEPGLSLAENASSACQHQR